MLVPTVTLFLFDNSLFEFELSFGGSLKEILLLEGSRCSMMLGLSLSLRVT
jgi:hypothetical protein